MSQPPKVVDFASLDDQNKTEFLQFLLKNNIEFQKSTGNETDDYVAKVTLKKNIPAENTRNSTKKQISKQLKNKMDKNDKNKKITPLKDKNAPNIRSQNKQNTNTKKIDKLNKTKSPSPQPIALKQNTMIPNNRTSTLTPKRSQQTKQVQKNKKSPTNQKTNKSQKVIKNHQRMNSSIRTAQFMPNYHKVENYQYSGTSKHNKKSSTTRDLKNEKKNESCKGSIELKKRTHLQKESFELFNKYLKLFQLKLAGNRTTKWPLSQLHKFIQQIYCELFTKNHLSGISTHRKKIESRILHRLIKEYLVHKHKNERIAINHLINLLYSLSVYKLQIREYLKNNSNFYPESRSAAQHYSNQVAMKNGLQVFEDFILGNYEEEDFWFFLFVRNIVKKYEHKSLEDIFGHSTNGKRLQDLSESTILGQTYCGNNQEYASLSMERDGLKILEDMFHGQPDLVEEYYHLIVEKLKQNNKNGDKIHSIEILKILVDDYCIKRTIRSQQAYESREKEQVVVKKSHKRKISDEQNEPGMKTGVNLHDIPSIKDLQLKLNVEEESLLADDLTFGDQTKEEQRIQREIFSKRIQGEEDYETNSGFWKVINQSIYENICSYSIQQEKHLDSQYSQLNDEISGYSIENLLILKMHRKVHQLVNIMVESHSYYNSKRNRQENLKEQTCRFNISLYPKNQFFLQEHDSRKEEQNQFINEFCSISSDFHHRENSLVQQKKYLEQIILKKCLALLGCIIQMDKLKWFQELCIAKATETDMIFVQRLQLMYRRLQKQKDGKAIGDLCKTVITVDQLTEALQKLFISA